MPDPKEPSTAEPHPQPGAAPPPPFAPNLELIGDMERNQDPPER